MATTGTAKLRDMNHVIECLRRGEVVFGVFATSRDADAAIEMARNPDWDFVFYDMEHAPFDVEGFRRYLQFLLDPAALRAQGPTPRFRPVLARVPAYGREPGQWMAKQVLDQGAHGVIVPHIENGAQALQFVRGLRYPHQPGCADAAPDGQRGFGAQHAARYWGLTPTDYQRVADLWPLDPDGQLLSMALVENPNGVDHIDEIVRTPGLSVVTAAPGDIGVSYGDPTAAEAAIQRVRAACQAAGVACGMTAGPQDVARRVAEGFSVIMVTNADALRLGRAAAGRVS